jgi:hypothetical protein
MISGKSILVFVLAAVSSGIVGCIPFGDPVGVGVSGDITLSKGVDASAFKTLKVIAIVDTGTPFDPSHPVFTGPAPEGSVTWNGRNEALKAVTFPFAYESDASVSPTETERWRIFAWLSAQDEPIKAPESGFPNGAEPFPMPGEPYGTAVFAIGSCDRFGGFCGITEGVNLTLDQTAP